MQIMGQLNVHVQSNGQTAALVLVVVAGDGPSLFGRNWLKYIRLNWSRIATVRAKAPGVQTLLQKHESLFSDELGTVQPQKATLHVKPDATPKFFKPCPVPFAIKDAIGQELDRLEKQGIVRKVDSSDWAAPILCAFKAWVHDCELLMIFIASGIQCMTLIFIASGIQCMTSPYG